MENVPEKDLPAPPSRSNRSARKARTPPSERPQETGWHTPFPPPKTTNPRRIPKEALDMEPTVCRTNALKPIDPTAFSRNPIKPIVPTTHVRDVPSVPPTNVSWTTTEQPLEDLRLHREIPVLGAPVQLNSTAKAPDGNRPAHPRRETIKNHQRPSNRPLQRGRESPLKPLRATVPETLSEFPNDVLRTRLLNPT